MGRGVQLSTFLSVTQTKHLLACDLGNNRINVFELTGKFGNSLEKAAN